MSLSNKTNLEEVIIHGKWQSISKASVTRLKEGINNMNHMRRERERELKCNLHEFNKWC